MRKRQNQEQKFALCSKISNNGFWMPVEDSLTRLSKLPNETKKAALKDQLKFKEIILCQEYANRSVFQISKAKKQFSSHMLDNLCKLINTAQELPTIEYFDQSKAIDWNTHSAWA